MPNFHVHIKASPIHGFGLFTPRDIPEGSPIILVADILRRATGYPNGWITKSGRHVNHQKKSNCYLVQDGARYYLHAKRDIKAGEELTSDYTAAPPVFDRIIIGYKEL